MAQEIGYLFVRNGSICNINRIPHAVFIQIGAPSRIEAPLCFFYPGKYKMSRE